MAQPLKKNGKIIAWRENPIILQRMEVGLRAWSEARAPSQQLAIVNAWCTENNYPTITERTMRDDRARSLAAATEALDAPANERLAEHVLMYKHVIRKIYEELEATEAQRNDPKIAVARATSLGNLIKAQSEWARTAGDTVVHVENKVTSKTDNEKAQVIVQVLVQRFGTDEAERILAEVAKLEQGGEVIDVESKRLPASTTVTQST